MILVNWNRRKILNKNGKLDVYERKEIEKHPETGWRILSSSNEFAELAKYILGHHERWMAMGIRITLRAKRFQWRQE